jgi:class 3 adenylate cyclase
MEEQKLVVAVFDLTGYTRLTRERSHLEVARLLDDYYGACGKVIAAGGGRVVKLMGDACLAVFPEERAPDAVAAAVALIEEVRAIAGAHRARMESGANLHLATVAAGEIGPEGARRFDVIGEGVNHTFLMGGGAGVRISEPVYRRLPSGARTRWEKRKPPATYVLQ